jgi:DNA-binding transcriptional MerR regulator
MHINLPEKLYYKIGEIASAFDVNTSLIRYWEKEIKILNPKKNKNGNRLFTQKDVETFKQIYFLVKEKGFTLDGAKQKLKEKNTLETTSEVSSNYHIISKLEKIKNELLLIKASIE